ncbi:MAG: hypothetical protein ACREQR_03025 [Candidatus Binataceae bacterium]
MIVKPVIKGTRITVELTPAQAKRATETESLTHIAA